VSRDGRLVFRFELSDDYLDEAPHLLDSGLMKCRRLWADSRTNDGPGVARLEAEHKKIGRASLAGRSPAAVADPPRLLAGHSRTQRTHSHTVSRVPVRHAWGHWLGDWGVGAPQIQMSQREAMKGKLKAQIEVLPRCGGAEKH